MDIIRETILREFKSYKFEIEEKIRKGIRSREKDRKENNIENRAEAKKRKRGDEEKIEDRSKKRKNEDKEVSRNQEWMNLTVSEKRGLKKLRNKIKKGEITIVKTDKSGKLMAMKKEDYLKFGIKGLGGDRKVDRN